MIPNPLVGALRIQICLYFTKRKFILFRGRESLSTIKPLSVRRRALMCVSPAYEWNHVRFFGRILSVLTPVTVTVILFAYELTRQRLA